MQIFAARPANWAPFLQQLSLLSRRNELWTNKLEQLWVTLELGSFAITGLDLNESPDSLPFRDNQRWLTKEMG